MTKAAKPGPETKAAGSSVGRFFRTLGPGLVTGAADDDPSGIATYSQVGAQFGYGLSWTLLLSWPLMAVIQMIAAEIGRVSGTGIARNLRRHYPRPLLAVVVVLLLIANIINLGADLSAMGAAAALIVGGNAGLYTLLFGIVCIVLEVRLSYARYAAVLKWTTLSLFAYVAVVIVAGVPWGEALTSLVVPQIQWTAGLCDGAGRDPGHHHQPLSLLLAGKPGNRRGPSPPCEAAVRRAPRGGRRTQADPDRHADRHGPEQFRGARHRLRDGGDAARAWRHQHHQLGAGGAGPAPPSPAISLSLCSRSASSVRACSRCRCSPGARPMP